MIYTVNEDQVTRVHSGFKIDGHVIDKTCRAYANKKDGKFHIWIGETIQTTMGDNGTLLINAITPRRKQ